MNYKELLNSAAKWGLVIGILMSLSRVYELGITTGGDGVNFTPFVFEWLIAVSLYVYLIFRANKARRDSLPEEMKFGLGEIINYSILISIFASFLVGITTHIYVMNLLGGYDIYVEKSMETIRAALETTNIDPEISKTLLQQGDLAVENTKATQPTIFSSIFSSIANYIMYGFFTALAIAGFVKRRTRDKA